MSHYDPYAHAGFNEDAGGIADRMYRRLHEDNSYSNTNAAAKPKGPKIVRPPVALTCYLCGQQFGTASLDIHQKQCYTKKLLQWERGDPDTRGPRPVLRSPNEAVASADDSRGASNGGAYSGMSAKQVEEFNNNQFQDFQKESLVPCENCGRTFFPDRLQVHLRSCKPGATARPVRKSTDPASPIGTPSGASAPHQTNYDNRPIRRQASSAALLTPTHPPDEVSRPPTADSYDDGSVGHTAQSSPEGRKMPTPMIPHLHLHTHAPQTPRGGGGEEDEEDGEDAVVFDDESRYGSANGGGITFNNNTPQYNAHEEEYGGGYDHGDEEGYGGGSASPPSAAQKPKPKPAIDRPLDLSHVQSRFKAAAVNNLERCQFCKRTFAPDRLAKHEEVCIEKKTMTMKGGPIGMTPRVGGSVGGSMGSTAGKIVGEPAPRPATSSGPAQRSGAVTSRVTSSGYGVSRSTDNGPLTTRGGPSGASASSTANKIIRPANASSRPQSPSVQRPASRSPPPGHRSSVERGPSVSATMPSGKPAPAKIIQPAARQVSPPPSSTNTHAGHYSQVLPMPTDEGIAPPPVAETPPRAKFCTECGTKLYAAAQKFCGECGHRVEML